MSVRPGRRRIAFLTALLLGLGIVAQGVMAANVGLAMTPATMDMPASQGCDGCGGDEGLPEALCYGLSGCSAAVLPSSMPAISVVHGQVRPHVARSHARARTAPDPYPPKPVILI